MRSVAGAPACRHGLDEVADRPLVLIDRLVEPAVDAQRFRQADGANHHPPVLSTGDDFRRNRRRQVGRRATTGVRGERRLPGRGRGQDTSQRGQPQKDDGSSRQPSILSSLADAGNARLSKRSRVQPGLAPIRSTLARCDPSICRRSAKTDQTQRPFDLFLIFAGANIVATTLQVGASLPSGLGAANSMAIIAVGAVAGAALVAGLAPIGTRLRVPSIVAARAALGFSGAQTLALLLFLTNFAWIALNNVIAASITVRLTGIGTVGLWATVLGILATLVVLGGPHAVAVVDRVAVPLLALSGAIFTIACFRVPWPASGQAVSLTAAEGFRGLDVVAGYQVTWLLMFADYPRFVRSARGAGVAVFLGLALTALWFMPLGFIASMAAQSSDPGAMVAAVGIGWWGAVLLALATLTTNFVNIYMSALAFKSLLPSDRRRVQRCGSSAASAPRWVSCQRAGSSSLPT